MEGLLISPYVLALRFFTVVFVYSSVGLRGGSSYTALMAIAGVSYLLIPTISFSITFIIPNRFFIGLNKEYLKFYRISMNR